MGVKTEIALNLTRTAAELTAMFSPVPGVLPAVELLCAIIDLCDKIPRNKNAARHLRDRCCQLMESYKEAFERADKLREGAMKDALEAIYLALIDIKMQMHAWTLLSFTQSLTQQDKIKSDIERRHIVINDCFSKFQVMSQLEMHEWKREFEENARRDHEQLVDYLSGIQHAQEITQQTVNDTNKMMVEVIGMMQQMLGESLRNNERWHRWGLSSNLHQLVTQAEALLPDLHLRSGEVKRVGHYPVSGTPAMDIYEGLYLDTEKVAIKMVRAVKANEKSFQRFKREVEIWRKVWYKDKGQHVLPFYGFCDNDGPYPYMISPWQPNGNALNYVKKNDRAVNYKNLIIGIAKGVQVLHTMSPSVVHGDIKAANIVINSFGRPLLADFGLSKFLEDVTGVPFTQSQGVSDSYRWFAPELCVGSGILSLDADIYAYAMTVLEIFTHNQPFFEIKHNTEVVIRAFQGQHPARPTSPDAIRRGMDDELWNLLLRCWSREPTERPKIHKVLDILEHEELHSD